MSPRKVAAPTLIGTHIIRLRKKRGWTTADLARESGLSNSTVRNIEKGYSQKPSEQILRVLAKTLEVDEGILLAAAGYGDLPKLTQEQMDAQLDGLGEDAPKWREALEYVKHRMTLEQQRIALATLLAQIDVASRNS